MKIPQNWTFEDKGVATNFNNHVREQLPWYDFVTQAIIHISRHYISEKGLVYDLGASTGNIGNSIKDILKQRQATFIAIEKSKEMVEQYTCDYGTVVQNNIKDYNYQPFDLSILFLTIMFLEPKYRSEFLATLYSKLEKGGAILIVDKIESIGGYIGTINYRLTLAEKLKTGTTTQDIIEKELSLQGVQRPINYELIKPYNPTLFFKFSDFVGYIIEK